jgi:eukaryotic-like serine/threonine-protein kinase
VLEIEIIMIGKSILHYKILEKLGEGAMGIVYKAEDTKLKRYVALKFLPTNILQGKAEKERFVREAQAAAALNHANIAHIYAIEEVDDPTSSDKQIFIAMEYVEGHELSEIIDANGGSPLKIEEAINFATQIAAGLQSAHEKGVVHRDIKSANIMVTAKGQIKIMDFGLAKLTDRTKMTMEGTTMGTVAYMSPEQASGENIDQRSDIWSLGVVLYEMISGQLPFKGAHDASMIYSVMNNEPKPLTALRSNLPIELDGIIFKTLAKDPDLRYQHVDELPADLKSLGMPSSHAPFRVGTSRISQAIQQEKHFNVRVGYSWKTILMIAIPVLITFFLTWFLYPGSTPSPTKPLNKMTVELPQDVVFSFSSNNRMAISPDGTRMVHMVFTAEPPRRLYLKQADSYEMTELHGSKTAVAPFFSPDGKWIGYFNPQTEKICKIPADGGEPLVITGFKDGYGLGATWAWDNSIIFTGNTGLYRVSVSGGETLQLTKTRSAAEIHGYPCILEDGKSVLFTIAYDGKGLDSCRLAVYSFGDDDYRIITGINGYNALYSPSGHILYGSSAQLMGVPFDLKRLEVAGPPAPVLDNVKTDLGTGSMSYALSREGTLIFVPRKEDNLKWISFVNLSGVEGTFSDIKKYFNFARYAPNGKYVAFGLFDNAYNIWIYNTSGGAINPLTFYKEGYIPFAWSPDSRHIAYATRAEDSTNSVYIKRIDGSGNARKIYSSPLEGFMSVTDWSADGKFLTIFQFNNDNSDCFIYSFQDSTVKPLLTTPANEGAAQFSPNGKWLLFTSNQSGKTEVYVQPLPYTRNGVWKISQGGGNDPLWSPDGQRIYYRRQNTMYAVDVTATNNFSKGTPKKIFEGNYFSFSGRGRRFDIHPDGDRFIMIQQPGGTNKVRKIFVIQNFDKELQRLMPVTKD